MQEHQQGGFPIAPVPSVTLNNGMEMPAIGLGGVQTPRPL
jgi:hypothetical protein